MRTGLGEKRSLAVRIGSGAALVLGPVLLVLCLAPPAEAQRPPVREQDRPGEGLREAERAGRAATAASKLRPLEPGEKVTYQDVLAHPDDVELNYLYAQSQVAAGELRGAASTLERILLVAPDLARVRLLYAVVLFRLDNLSESEREFRTVSKLPMPESLREEVNQYLEEIELRRRVTRMSGALGFGAQWDSNRNAGPEGNEVLFLDRPFDLVTGQKQSDFSGLGLASFQVQHDLGYDAGHTLIGGAQIYGQKQVDVTELDLMSISGEAGGLYRAPGLDIQPSLFGSYLNLAGETYVSTVGAGIRASHRFSQKVDLTGRFRADYEFFEKLENSPITDQRTGIRYEGGLGLAWAPLPFLRFDAGAAVVSKDADEVFYSYTGPQIGLGATWLLGRGQFVLSTFGWEYDIYQGPEQIISSETRRDSMYRGRISYGAPLGFFLQHFSPPRAVRDTVLTLNSEYLNVQSTIPNYQYDDWRFSFLFTKSFDF